MCKSFLILMLTYGHEPLNATKERRSRVQAFEIGFLSQIAGTTSLNIIRAMTSLKHLDSSSVADIQNLSMFMQNLPHNPDQHEMFKSFMSFTGKKCQAAYVDDVSMEVCAEAVDEKAADPFAPESSVPLPYTSDDHLGMMQDPTRMAGQYCANNLYLQDELMVSDKKQATASLIEKTGSTIEERRKESLINLNADLRQKGKERMQTNDPQVVKQQYERN
ncbi:unnamed protein product [Soboliphyme baturini]|uniref:CID domain-containing protein n=1 Tax=Soboliphyme baturini TaxID=241478 RepID=A0A183IGH1_9BILA|nr:unnamed protein product [Soboliphyme baturini]